MARIRLAIGGLVCVLTTLVLSGCRGPERRVEGPRALIVIPADKPECYDAKLKRDCPIKNGKGSKCEFVINVRCTKIRSKS